MNFQQIRNATVTITYAGKKFLIDPWLQEKGAFPPVPAESQERNPTVALPMSIDEIIKNVDAVIVTHIHPDHFDEVAAKVIPKDTKMFAQNKEEAEAFKGFGFKDVEILKESGTLFGDIKLTKTNGIHAGDEEIVRYFTQFNVTCNASGVVFSNRNEKTVYIAGDTIWCDAVKEAIDTHKPDIIILNAGGAQFVTGGHLIMNANDVYEVYKAAPQAKIIASHMEAVNHARVTRRALKQFVEEKGMSSNVLIPVDGEAYTF
ncbi:putative Zn-dependent hydrolase of beta-lactamase fold protein [Desulfoscipio gibsoniae DSM 7213]|uniref:Putative Zn-dependent hydrolase of beta-lactamase fold protein n=2 Tax=Desulfoscipio gibsoniae TaxID=102134 RepID=R4KP26_9FIRM|nr:putative Zn-dependent hydrolase of beta-lactamase fold protein [Desulfoscipio gibsoniae DSM 7213]